MAELVIYAMIAIIVGAPLVVAAWVFIEDRFVKDEPQEPGDQSHHPDSLRNVFRINGRRDDA
jgi:hypothetical protein